MTQESLVEQSLPPFSIYDIPQCQFGKTSLKIKPGLSFGVWHWLVEKLQEADTAVQWWLGDALNYGEHAYGDKYTQAVEDTGRSKQVLMNYASVARRIETSRRREDVPYSIHVEVACLPPKEQEEVLAKAAEDSNPTVREMRRQVGRIQRKLGKTKSEIELLHTPEVQEYLKRYIETVRQLEEEVPLTARFLRNMAQSHAAQANWQKSRTVDDDCQIIRDAVIKSSGQMAEDDLYQWLMDHGYFMSDPEFEERLEYMNRDDVRLALVTNAGKDGKQEDRRGSLPSIIVVPWAKVWNQGSKRPKEDDEDD